MFDRFSSRSGSGGSGLSSSSALFGMGGGVYGRKDPLGMVAMGLGGGSGSGSGKVSKLVSRLFPNQIEIKPPTDPVQLQEWKTQIEKDKEKMKNEANANFIKTVLDKNRLCCNDLDQLVFKKALTLTEAERIVGIAFSHHLMNPNVVLPSLPASQSTSNTAIKSATEVKNRGDNEPAMDLENLSKVSTSDSNFTPKVTGIEATPKDSSVGLKKSTSEEQTPAIDNSEKNSEQVTEEPKNEEMEVEESKRNKPKAAERTFDPILTPTITTTEALPGPQTTTSTTTTTVLPVITLSKSSLLYAMRILQEMEPPPKKSIFDIDTENDFEKRLLPDVIPPTEVALHFDDIGALDSVKETLKELVMLPLQRPELFRKGNLTRPCKGILLFGPPGTGKTMLAKAVATESGANFLSISMASIGSKWFGEGERYARAVFTLASKISPCVIFIDEVDSILGRRSNTGEHEAMRKIKTEFMMMWDGLRTRDSERVLVLAATNRPFDLDEAVLRRLPRRLLIDLPDQKNRVKILKVILKGEDLDTSLDIEELASMTEGFSGSDLKNFCVAAAYRPIRELIKKEKEEKEEEKKQEKGEKEPETEERPREVWEDDKTKSLVENKAWDMVLDDWSDYEEKATTKIATTSSSTPLPAFRPLGLSDFKKAKAEVSASVSEDTFSIAELRKWNQQFGGGTGTRTSTLSYFT